MTLHLVDPSQRSLHFLHPLERPIVAAVFAELFAAGYLWQIYGPDQWGVKHPAGRTVPMAMLGPDEDTILEIYDPARPGRDGSPAYVGGLLFAHGKGADVLWSYSPVPELVAICGRFTPTAVVSERFGA